jgi:hypothetical protein
VPLKGLPTTCLYPSDEPLNTINHAKEQSIRDINPEIPHLNMTSIESMSSIPTPSIVSRVIKRSPSNMRVIGSVSGTPLCVL